MKEACDLLKPFKRKRYNHKKCYQDYYGYSLGGLGGFGGSFYTPFIYIF